MVFLLVLAGVPISQHSVEVHGNTIEGNGFGWFDNAGYTNNTLSRNSLSSLQIKSDDAFGFLGLLRPTATSS